MSARANQTGGPLTEPLVNARDDDESSMPLTFCNEARAWASIAVPTLLCNIMKTGLVLTNVSILGHYQAVALNNSTLQETGTLATKYLAASSYASTWINLSQLCIVQGFAGSLTVLCAGTTPKLSRSYLSIGLLFTAAVTLCLSPAIFFAGNIMQTLIRFDDEMRDLVNSYAKVALIGVLPLNLYGALNCFLLSSGKVYKQLFTSTVMFGANVALNFLLIYGADLGLVGSALATAVTRWCMFVVLLIATLAGEDSLEGLSPWSALRSSRVREYLWQSLPISLTGVLEDGNLEFVAIIAGWLGTTAAACHNGIFSVLWVLSSAMWAVTSATKVRISSYLAKGDLQRAKFTMKVSSCIALGTAVFVAVIMVGFHASLGKIFSRDHLVWAKASEIGTLVGSAYAMIAAFYVSMAVLSAQGRPGITAVAFVAGAWMVCVPLALFLHFKKIDSLWNGLFGLWVSLVVGYAITTLIALYFVIMSPWEKILDASLRRAEATLRKSDPKHIEEMPEDPLLLLSRSGNA